MTELKPCPFCGSKAEILTYGEGEYLPHCLSCEGMVEQWFDSEQEAIEAWNTRALPIPDTPEMVRALDDAYEAGRKSATDDATQHTHCCPCGAERTCRNAWQYGGDTFQCSECGCQLALDDGYGNTIEFADVPKQSYPNNPMYCVGCGAKVVNDDE